MHQQDTHSPVTWIIQCSKMATRRLVQASNQDKKPVVTDDNDEVMVSEEEIKMSIEDRVRLIDHEVRVLHRFCVDRGYNPWMVEKCAKPVLFQARGEEEGGLSLVAKQWGRWLYGITVVIAIISALAYCEPVYKTICAHSRIAAIKILPYWDWTQLYNQDCLIENPYYHGNELTEDDCLMCEDLEAIARISNVTHTSFAEDYLKRDIPVIITDAVTDWEAYKMFNIHFLNELYNHEEWLSEVMPCMFASNVRIKQSIARVLLRKAARGEISNWYAHWENCEKQAAKVIRQFYNRPYFIPPMVEMAESNWLFIASGYKGKKFKPADLGLPMMFLAQLKGETKVELSARVPCDKTCPKLYATLLEGETLVVTDLLWLLDYMPVSLGETVVIGAGGYFD